MTLEDKKLIYKDLCGRLPYNVKIKRSWIAPMTGSPEETITTFSTFDIEVLSTSIELNGADGFVTCDDGKTHTVRDYSCIPYLRPLSSITSEEEIEFQDINLFELPYTVDGIDWLNEHHFDYRGLIEKGLALKAGPSEDSRPSICFDYTLLYPITDEKLLKEDIQYKLQKYKKPDVIYEIKTDN